jgi:ABC-type transporter Mla maintaining outer membrane lipid asymmetry permease subunit MlaE
MLGGGLFMLGQPRHPARHLHPAHATRWCRSPIFGWGIIKAPVFGLIIAIAGCFQGMQVAGNAEDVGKLRTTASVVQAIFLVIVADAAFSILFSALGI